MHNYNAAHTQETTLKGEQQMTKYIVKRLLVLIPILLGVTLIIFTIMDFTPGTAARGIGIKPAVLGKIL